ncbi:DUF3949 domain-containing protein [Paenibacillus guangzhouensis]|uniref:DUF3949 domain-containing protein n=1 Tax=Paenibacillus guangzhouensis TaxID=1473112 RepID=UPI0012675A6C|nr:DUF3949 domain-containing protein [Paenibacillus guangzhouensis]
MSSTVITLILVGIALAYFVIMIPIQYVYIRELKQQQEKSGLSQSEMYEKMSFSMEQAHFGVQGNLFNIPSSIAANLIYQWRHRK